MNEYQEIRNEKPSIWLGKGGWVFFFSLFYYDTLKQLLSDQQFFTPLLTLCMPFWQVLLFLHMIKETKKNIDN
jgi:hypothetical protein